MKTDSEIQKDVMAELQWEPVLNPSEIGVAVKHGVVTLSGTVSNYAKKLAAEKATLRVKGVTAVAEELDIRFFESDKLPDNEIVAVTLAIFLVVLVMLTGTSNSSFGLAKRGNAVLNTKGSATFIFLVDEPKASFL